MLADKRRRLNAFAPVSRLPTELLVEIFKLHVEASITAKWQLGKLGSAFDYILYSHVCHRWRDVAIATPRLWTTIIVADKAYVAEMLTRTRKLPLDLHLMTLFSRYLGEEFIESQRMVFAQLKRVRRVEVAETEGYPWNPPLVDGRAPILRDVGFTHVGREGADAWVGGIVRQASIEEVDISAAFNGMRSLLFRPSLTRLTCAVLLTRGLAGLPILDALATMPLLEDLRLNGLVEVLLEPTGTAVRSIDLPKLASLMITGTEMVSCAELLDSMRFPSTARVLIQVAQFEDEDDPTPLCTNIATRFAGQDYGGYGPLQMFSTVSLSVKVDYKTVPEYRIRCWTAFYPADRFNSHTEDLPPPSLDVTYIGGDNPWFFTKFLGALPDTSSIKSLYLRNIGKYVQPLYCKTLSGLRQLCINEDSSERILEVLVARTFTPAEPRNGRLIFPELEVLRLENLKFRTRQSFRKVSLRVAYGNMLKARKQAGVPVQQLVLVHCRGVDARDVADFQSHVGAIQRLEGERDSTTSFVHNTPSPSPSPPSSPEEETEESDS